MSKYIEADELKQTFCAECNHTLKCEDCDIDYHFRYAPAADVQEVVKEWCYERNCVIVAREDFPRLEVRHGRWLEHREDRWIYAKCSVCNSVHDTKTNYCPACGARMDLDEVTE